MKKVYKICELGMIEGYYQYKGFDNRGIKHAEGYVLDPMLTYDSFVDAENEVLGRSSGEYTILTVYVEED